MDKSEYLIVFFTFVAVTTAGPAGLRPQEDDAPLCSQICTGTDKFKYEVGTTYEYNYEVETKTSILGASEDSSTIGINARVHVGIISKCEHVLKLSQVTIEASDSKKFTNQDNDREFARGLETYSLRFSFQDGMVESVCPHESEQPWALNFKKGVLSSFQNTMMNLQIDHNATESDVVGKCRTEYKLAQQGWESITIKKTKAMGSCTRRKGFETAMQTVPFMGSYGSVSLQILRGTYECDQVITTQGYMKSSHCHEIQLFKPFSKESSGAATETTQKLTFIQQSQGVADGQANTGKRQELFFDHDQAQNKFDLTPREGLELLREMCKATADDIKTETPSQFSSLVFIMKRMDLAGLRRIYNQVNRPNFCTKNGDRIKKFVLDALPMVGTAPAVELMKTLISNDDVKGTQADMWLASLAFIKNPTSDMIEQILQLTGLPSLSSKVLLPLSTLVHAYCHLHQDCEDKQEVKSVIQLLERNIGAGCVADQQNFRKIMMSLRGLGNTGHADFATLALDKCIYNEDNSMDIRVAAVQAYRRLSCGADRNNLIAIFRDPGQDSELRINAYIEVIRCPNPEVVSQIKDTLVAEENQQVGSFVWTHLTNLMESSDPANQYIQQLLNDEVLEKDFDLEKLKFSRNYEASLFLETFNAGGKFDSNVIFSPKSFVPRSASLNLTFNLFGESMNLFEVGARVEGLEHTLESYFGPTGYFNDKDKNNNEVPQANAKFARLSSSKLDDIHKKSKKVMDDLRGAIYTRMFGNEMSYNMFGAKNGIDEDMVKPDMFEFLKKLRNNEKQDLSMTKSLMFLDSTYTVPTVAGLPLNLHVNGSSTVALNADGKIDVKKPGSKIVIEGMFEPSGAVQLDSMMSVDAFVTKGGMKMVSTLYTSTGAKAKMELTNGNVFDFSFDLTKDKSEIINIQSSFFMVHNDMEKEQRMIVADRYEKSACTGDRVLKATGLVMCVGVSGPNATHRENAPNFPLTGPMTVSVSMAKNDLPNGFRLEAKTIKSQDQILFRFLSETPGSRNDRAIGLDVDVHSKQKTLDVNLVSPWKTASLKGELTDNAKVKGLLGTIDVDGKRDVYKLDAKILVEKTKDRRTYTPNVSLLVSGWKNIYLTGVLNYKEKESFDADLTITGALEDPITFQSTVQNTKTQIGGKMTLKWDKTDGYVLEAMTDRLVEKKKLTTRHTYKPRVYVRTPEKELVDMNTTVIYIEGKSLKVDGKLEKLFDDPVVLTGNIMKLVVKKREKYTGRLSGTFGKKYSKLMFLLDSRNWNFVSNKMKLEYNVGKGKKDTMIMKTKVKINNNSNNVKVTSSLNSLRNNDLDAAFSATFIRSKITSKLVSWLKYGKNYKKKDTKERLDLSFETTYKMKNVKKTVNYTLGFKLPAHKIDVSVTGGYIHDGKSFGKDISIKYHPQRTVSINFKLHNKTNNFPHYAGQIGFGLPEGREMFFAGAFGKESIDKYISSFEFEIIKGRKTKLDAMLKIATHKIYEAEVGVKLPDLDPVRVRGMYTREKDGFKADASFMRGPKLYSISGEGTYKIGKVYKLKLDTKVPERRVKLILDSSNVKSLSHKMIDIQWDADKNLDDRFLVNITTDFKGWEDFEVASTLHYPTRTIDFNMKHSSGPRYITSAHLSWSPKEKMEVKIIFRDDKLVDADRTELSVEFVSPFEDYEELGLGVSIIRDSSQYQTKSSVTWGTNKKILVSAKAKVPITANSIDVVGTITTPFKSYKNMVANIKHRFSDELDSSLLVDWGRERILTKVKGKIENTLVKRSFLGDLEIRTPFEGLRIFILHGEHNDDGRKFASKVTSDITINSEQESSHSYIMEMDMTHDHTIAILDNKGTIKINIPNDYFSVMWDVNAKLGHNHIIFHVTPQRGRSFKVTFKETHQFEPNRKLDTSLELVLPMEQIQELNAKFTHEDRENYWRTETLIVKDKVEMYFDKVFYERSPGYAEFETEVRSLYREDIKVTVTNSHSIMPYNVHAICQWAPYQVIDVNTYIFYDKFGTYDISTELTTPFKQVKKVTFTTKRERRGLNWEVSTNLEYAPKQSISVDTRYRIDHVKFTSVSIRTPFPQFSNLDASFKLDGNLYKFDGMAELMVVPYVNKISTNFNWAYYEGTSLTGAFNLNTPFRQYPYMKAKVNSNMLGVSRVSLLEVEYLPMQVVKIESDYRFSALDTLKGTIKVTSPYTENKEVVASFTHIGDREEFTTDAKITCECFERAAFTKATFSSKDAISVTFVMDSPFRGYETVDLKFNHRGEIKDFHTHLEYETNGEKMTIDNIFKVKKNVELQMTILTPFKNFSRSHFELTHKGKFPNTRTHSEVAFNEKEGHSDINLSHDDSSTIFTAEVVTPFKRYEKITGKIVQQGDIHDFEVEGEFKYSELWKTKYAHTFSEEMVTASALLASPLLDEDFSFEFNQTNKMNDFSSYATYSMGSAYRSTSETKLKYDLPDIEFKVKTDTRVLDEKKSNEILLLNAVKGKDYYFKFYTVVPKVLTDVEMSLKMKEDTTMDFDSHAILELPLPSLASTQVFYKANSLVEGTKTIATTDFTMETTMLEQISQVSREEMDVGDFVYTRTIVSKYGDHSATQKTYFDMKKFSLDYVTTLEDYRDVNIVVEYSGSIVDDRRRTKVYERVEDGEKISIRDGYYGYPDPTKPATLSIVGTVKSSALKGPVIVNYDLKLDEENEHRLQLQLPVDDFKKTDAVLTYEFKDQISLDFSMESSAMNVPVRASSNFRHSNMADFEISALFTSGFTNFTKLNFEVKNEKLRSAYTPFLKLSWEDSKKVLQEIAVDGKSKWVELESGQIELGLGLGMKTPFKMLQDMKFDYDYEFASSPLRVKDSVLVQHNGKKYFDCDTEFSAVDKYSGIVTFRAPTPMTYKLIAENKDESVNGDLLLNWNEDESNSHIRLQFDVTDSGDISSMKKSFMVRATHPQRTVGIHNQLERSKGKIIATGKVSWDEKNKKEVSYDVTYDKNRDDLHNAVMKVTVPSRSVEVSGSFKDTNGEKLGSASILWDAGKDRNKQVEVKMILLPNNVKKTGSLYVSLPSVNKKLSLTTDLIVGENRQILDGQTRFSYSPRDSKTVLLKYSILGDSTKTNSYRMGWSLVHEDTKTQIEMKSLVKATESIANGEVDFVYKKNDGGLEKVSLQGEANMDQRKAFVKVVRADDSAELSGHVTQESPYIMTLSTHRKDTVTWKTVWSLDTAQRTLDASMTYGEGKKEISTRAYMPSDKSFISETQSNTKTGTVQEGRLSTELEYRKLHGHIKWRPELVKDILTFSADCMNEMVAEINDALQSRADPVVNEVMGKWRRIRASVSQELSPIMSGIDEELREVQKELKSMRKELRKMYKQNDMYMKTVDETVDEAMKKMMSSYSKAIVKVGEAYTAVEERMEEMTNMIAEYQLKENYDKMVDKVKAAMKETRINVQNEIDIIFNTMRKRVEMMFELYDEAMDDISTTSRKCVTKLIDEIVLDPYIEDLKEFYKEVEKRYPSNEKIQDLLSQVQEVLNTAIREGDWIEKYKMISDKLSEQLNIDIIGTEVIKTMEELNSQVDIIYSYVDMDTTMLDLITKVSETVRQRMIAEFNQLPIGLLDLHRSKFTTFDLENGEIEFDLYLPIPMENFEKMMRFTMDKYKKKMHKMMDKYFPRRDFVLSDFYYSFPPVQWGLRRDWVPPFDAFATVAGKGHYIGFDGSHHDIAGLCSYVLATDVVDRNFTIVQKYTGGPRRLSRGSLVVMVHGTTVEMFADNKVKVDGQPRELPHITDSIEVIRSGNLIILTSRLGIKVTSDFERDYHIIGLSGWYFGKVAGILGSFDNEPSNDKSLPEGRVESNLRRFMNSWEVGASCRSSQFYGTTQTPVKSEKCMDVFEKTTSSLRSCFLKIDPEHYQHSCDVDESSMCNLATLYAHVCSKEGISVSLPTECMKCSNNQGSMFQAGETLRYERQEKKNTMQDSLDVVMIVEEKQCNRDVIDKLTNVVYEMDQAFNRAGLSNNQFSLLGYTEDKVHQHTMEGQTFNDASKFAMAIESLKLSPSAASLSDPYRAIRSAMNLQFRTGVSKVFVLVSCMPCEQGGSYKYQALSSELEQRDITVHVMRKTGFQLKTNRSPNSPIFGIDKENVFTGQAQSPVQAQHQDVNIPEDYCSNFAVNTNGSIFDSSHVLSGRVRQQKEFLKTVGDRVGVNDDPSECQVCTCEADAMGLPRSVCRRCGVQSMYSQYVPRVMSSVVSLKNSLTNTLQKLF